ncbi:MULTISPECIES: hypothetical protein [unclassified Chelatococcus]|uniref:hypothetical protein n=1 Tax=unclassified Chelatococcus TaxID=2638111 RepID=UPI001BCEF4C9|nr:MULTISPECIES: hypothetical protein [unclassified Chelatococcus]CAH1672294.1 hypothetical protein CHELA20_50901 [Hyphomicrobiales bacterium]MBS7738965.1 hypothetical protein [Chelatococcus sp. HY11]MBX3543398.1 hypothetical protein [Chelatococcus sp.]MCO5076505.1 hypothetical protein [Chelatococcus sp.]CAH1675471.1 hypothetical protein CHELA41_24112 [Hyphomicrobiales bacterium]
MNAATAKATPAPASTPQAGWRNCRIAPFWFSPEPLSSEEEVLADISAQLQQFRVHPSAISATTSAVHVLIGKIRFSVDIRDGTVSAWGRDSQGGWDNPLCSGYPDKFEDAFVAPADRERHRDDLEEAKALARYLSELFKGRIKDAAIIGTLHVMARIGSPLAPYERILPDQWRHFKMRPIVQDLYEDISFYDDESDVESEADGPGGAVLYSVMFAPGVVPGVVPKRKPGRPQSSHPLVKPVVGFLIQEHVCKPKPEGWTKKNLLEIAQEKFGTIDPADWNRAWARVKKHKEFHRSWEVGGAPKKPAQK